MTLPMRERAAKVAEDEADGILQICNDQDSWNMACYIIADKIRALPDSPDPTRAALEECVRAMGEARNLIGAKTDAMTDAQKSASINAAWHILHDALSTARNALGTEK